MCASILVIEDDHDTRVSLRGCLEEAGFSVTSAANGAYALELLAKMPAPNAILLDIKMPVMNGDQFLRAIAENQELCSVPIIQISAAEYEPRRGVQRAFSKPLDLEVLIESLSSFTKRCKAGAPVST